LPVKGNGCVVNTVNCVGVMSKGIALEFKLRYPEMFKGNIKRHALRNIFDQSKSFFIEKESLFIFKNLFLIKRNYYFCKNLFHALGQTVFM
jgi:hypothetical protein